MAALAGTRLTAPDGTERLVLRQGLKWRTVALSQIAQFVNGSAITVPGLTPMPVPGVATALDGSEQLQIFQGAGWRTVCLAQLRAWFANGAVIPLAPALDGGSLAGLPIDTLSASDAISVAKPPATLVLDMATLLVWLGPAPPLVTNVFGQMDDAAGNGMVDGAANRFTGNIVTDPGGLLKDLAASKRITFGTAIQGDTVMSAAGPTGYATRKDWIAANVDLFVPGSVMMPDNFNPAAGSFSAGGINAFLADARARGKKIRAHCSFYPKRDIGTWIDTALQQNPGQWQALLAARIDFLAGLLAPYSDILTNNDGINEVFTSANTNAGGWRTNPWNTAAATVAGRNAATATQDDYLAPCVFALQRLRQQLPGVPIYWCSDLSEALASGTFTTYAANIRAGIQAARAAGAPVDGYNMQGHLQNRIAFSATALRTFLQNLTVTDGLKLIIGEHDTHTGSSYTPKDTRYPSEYSVAEYDCYAADMMKQFLDVALPFVVSSGGGQFLSWSLDDGYNSWTPAISQEPAGERPSPYDSAFQAKPQLAAIRNALLEI
jgi:hypothetical protein